MNRAQRLGLALAMLIVAWLSGAWADAQSKEAKKTEPTFGRPQIDAVKGAAKVLDDAKIVDFGKTIFQGKVDINPTLQRIRDGKTLNHRNDGSIFLNKEGKLPRKKDREYYREFVMQMKNVPFPGPVRVVIGKQGEVYFTGDHYHSFTRVN